VEGRGGGASLSPPPARFSARSCPAKRMSHWPILSHILLARAPHTASPSPTPTSTRARLHPLSLTHTKTMSRPLRRPHLARSSTAAVTSVPVSMTRDELVGDEDLTPYEKARAAQLERNRARLAELAIPAAAARLAPAVQPKTTAAKKGVAARKKRPVSVIKGRERERERGAVESVSPSGRTPPTLTQEGVVVWTGRCGR
jgi:hypothetical protein